MPIIYRGPPQETPPWLDAFAGHLQRLDEYIGLWDPLYWRPDAPEARGLKWVRASEQWDVAIAGQFIPADYVLRGTVIRANTGPMLLPVSDGNGRDWHAPAILNPAGEIDLVRPLAMDDDGNWHRQPTEAQAGWIRCAESARAELLTIGDDGRPRFLSMPLTVVAGWAATLLSSVYPLNPQALGRLGLMTDDLIRAVLLASAGLVRE